MTTVFAVSLLVAINSSQGQIEPLYPDVDFMRPETRNRKGKLAPEYALAKWPKQDGPNSVPNARVPKSLRLEADKWFRRVISSQLLPSDLSTRLKGYRLPSSDIIFDRYGTPAGLKLQLIEDEVGICVLFKDDLNVEEPTTELIETYVATVANRCFALSAIQRDQLTITSKHFPDPMPDGIWSGTLHVDDAGLSAEEMGWWNQISFFTDGDSIEFFVHKWMPGDHPMNGQGGNSPNASRYRGRFDGPG